MTNKKVYADGAAGAIGKIHAFEKFGSILGLERMNELMALLGNPAVREVFMRHHADLLDPAFWQGHQQRIREGHVHDVYPYERSRWLA